MIGTLINIGTVALGGVIGLFFGGYLPPRFRDTVISGLGLFTFAIGIKLFLETHNAMIAVGAILIGGLLGEWWNIEAFLQTLGAKLESRFASREEDQLGDRRFIRGFLTATLLFEVGPMTILGAIQDGLSGDYSLLAIKSVMDGFAAFALASALGVGVLFSVLGILIYQGGITLLAAQAQAILSEAMIAELTAVGGVLLLGLAIGSLLELRPIKTGNLLPAIVVAPLIVWVIEIISR